MHRGPSAPSRKDHLPMTESTTQDQEQLREAVRQRYAAAATRVARGHTWAESPLPVLEATSASCCSPESTCACDSAAERKDATMADLYTGDQIADLPGDAVLASLGCGNPTALAELEP